LSKTGGGRGTNQYRVKGAGKTALSKRDNQNPEGDPILAPEPNREWDLHAVQFGETPIDEDARDFLTDRYRDIQTKNELNLAESENIFGAMEWV